MGEPICAVTADSGRDSMLMISPLGSLRARRRGCRTPRVSPGAKEKKEEKWTLGPMMRTSGRRRSRIAGAGASATHIVHAGFRPRDQRPMSFFAQLASTRTQ